LRWKTGRTNWFGFFLYEAGIPYDSCPGVSACFGAAASLNLEYTLPGVSQTLIITRLQGRTRVPEAEAMESLAAHKASMAIYLSAGMMKELSEKLIAGGYEKDSPAAIIYKATWPEEKTVFCTVGTLGEAGTANSIDRSAVVLVGDAVNRKTIIGPDFMIPRFLMVSETVRKTRALGAKSMRFRIT
jgi:precorrin-4/cobalt-precorrin-4 C11-methyltransferase